MEQEKFICVILGMHRSGTSLVSSFIHALYPNPDIQLLEASKDNPEGYWEDLEVLKLNIEILNFLNSDWDSLYGIEFSPSLLQELDSNFGDQAKELLKRRLEKSANWFFKDPRTTKLLPFWLNQLLKSKVKIKLVFCNRSPLASAHSLKSRDNFSIEHALILYSLYMQTSIPLLVENEFFIVNYEELFNKDDHQLQGLAIFLGNEKESESDFVSDFVEAHLKPELNHHQNHLKQESYPSTPFKWHQLILDIKFNKMSKVELNERIDRFQLMADATRDVGRLAQSYVSNVRDLESQAKNTKALDGVAIKLKELGKEYADSHHINKKNNEGTVERDALSNEVLESIRSELEDLNVHLRISQEHRDALQFQTNTLESEVIRLWGVVEKHKLDYVSTQSELNEVYSSLSWKISKPFRFLARAILFISPKKIPAKQRTLLLKERSKAGVDGLRDETDDLNNRKSLPK